MARGRWSRLHVRLVNGELRVVRALLCDTRVGEIGAAVGPRVHGQQQQLLHTCSHVLQLLQPYLSAVISFSFLGFRLLKL